MSLQRVERGYDRKATVQMLGAAGFLCLIEAFALAVLPLPGAAAWLHPVGVAGSLALGAGFLGWARSNGLDLGWQQVTGEGVRPWLLRLGDPKQRGDLIWTLLLNALLGAALVVAVLPLLAIVRAAMMLAGDHGAHGSGDYIGLSLSFLALLMGSIFFVYSIKYYLGTAVVLLSAGFQGPRRSTGLSHMGDGEEQALKRIPEPAVAALDLGYHPFISVHIASYNERRVIERLLECCASFNYPNYEVIWVDDSNDASAEIRERWSQREGFKVIHRSNREGYKGGALTGALKAMDPRAEYVAIFDADAMPFPDALQRFLPHFYSADGKAQRREQIAAVQSYQWHVLNKSESWLTEAVRTEYAGSYMIERPFQDMIGSMKMIAGTAYMIRADLLKELGWGKSLTEDWELTLRLYARGYKVAYTPNSETPAECVSTFSRLARQRMRWAEGHTFNVRRWFLPIMRSAKISPTEKFEFALYSTYYLQAVYFLIGSVAWMVAEVGFKVHIPEWTALLGWSLLFTNVFSLPLMNLGGLLLEDAPRKDLGGVMGAVALSYLLVPFQGYAALKGLLEKNEGPWYRTPKTGRKTKTASPLGKLAQLRRSLLGSGGGTRPLAVHSVAAAPPRRGGTRRLGWGLIGALVLTMAGLGLQATKAPVAMAAAGTPFYLHSAGPYTMDSNPSSSSNKTFAMTAALKTRTWATTTATAAAQTIPASTTFAFNYWTTGAAGATANADLTFGYSSSPNCAVSIALVQAGPEVSTPNSTAEVGTLNRGSTAGDLLVATITSGTATPFSGPTGWVKAAALGSGVGETEIWYLEDKTGGISSATFTSAANGGTIQLTEWSGVLGSGSLDTFGTSQASTVSAGSGLTTASGELAVTLFDEYPYPTTWTPGAGWTNLYGDAIGDASDYKLGNAAGQTTSETMKTDVAGNWLAAIATFRPARSVTPIAQARSTILGNGSNQTTANFSPAAAVTVPAGSYFCYTMAVNSVTGGGLALNYDAAANPSNLNAGKIIFIPELGLPLIGLALVGPLILRRRSRHGSWPSRIHPFGKQFAS